MTNLEETEMQTPPNPPPDLSLLSSTTDFSFSSPHIIDVLLYSEFAG
jgi:hypothetical protein